MAPLHPTVYYLAFALALSVLTVPFPAIPIPQFFNQSLPTIFNDVRTSGEVYANRNDTLGTS
jgi:hypothetical protein